MSPGKVDSRDGEQGSGGSNPQNSFQRERQAKDQIFGAGDQDQSKPTNRMQQRQNADPTQSTLSAPSCDREENSEREIERDACVSRFVPVYGLVRVA